MRKFEANDSPQPDMTVGLLLSGGLDSAILLHCLLQSGSRVQPFYVDCGLIWQPAELRATRRYLAAVDHSRLSPLVLLSFPLDDIYENHWSITGRKVPSAATPDEAVFLPGRNLFLVIKVALWCQLHGIRELALATLKSNRFPDATPGFFQAFESTLQTALHREFRITRPFESYGKPHVMKIGRDLPLELTFSCISPIDDQHCGSCNKCAERQAAFRDARINDLTPYANKSAVAADRPVC